MGTLIEIFNKKVIRENEILIWWLGGASFYLRSKDKKIIIDPYLTNSVYDTLKPFFKNPEKELNRLKSSILDPDEINCDYFVCTHDHLDHLDPETIRGISDKSNIIFIGPESCGKHFKELGIPNKNINTIRKGESFRIDNNLKITAVNAKHAGPLDVKKSLKLNKEIYGEDDGQGYIIKINSISIYHTSDTEYLEDFQNLKDSNIDVILLAANGKGGNLTPEEGVKLVEILKPRVVIPMHYGIIPFTNFNPQILKLLFKKFKINSELKILGIGDFYKHKKKESR